MIVLLELKEDSYFEIKNSVKSIFKKQGFVVKAKFTEFGVKLLFDGEWSLPYHYESIVSIFKVYKQEEC